MKLEKIEGSENYCVTVVKLPPKQKVEGLDKLVKVTVFGNDVLTQKDTDEEQLYLFFPAESQISREYLSVNNEFRDNTLNKDKDQKGFFEPHGRVKALKFKGVISTGYLAPLFTLRPLLQFDADRLKEGDEFNSIDGKVICKKYKIVHQHATSGQQTESKFNKKLKKFSKLIANQFRFHVSTAHLAKNLHHFENPRSVICITDKFHGTSAVYSNILVKEKLDWKHRLAKWFGIKVVDTKYDNLYSSRSVIKNEHINETVTKGYYNEDIWGIVNKELEGKIEQGISIYGEIVGYLPSGKMIQKDYDYGCKENEHKFVVYRLTYTKPDGNVIEFSWKQIENYCKKHSLETVPVLFYGNIGTISPQRLDAFDTNVLFDDLCRLFLEKDCIYCKNKVPAEGIVVRLDHQDSFSAFKLKSKRFLEKETKELDKGEINIEDDATVDNL